MPRFNMAATITYDANNADTSFVFTAWPEGFPDMGFGERGVQLVPPAGKIFCWQNAKTLKPAGGLADSSSPPDNSIEPFVGGGPHFLLSPIL